MRGPRPGGVRKADAFPSGGLRPVREVVLRSGPKVMGTPNHRLLVASKDGLEWRRLDEIEEGEAVALRYGAGLWSLLSAAPDGVEAGGGGGTRQVAGGVSGGLGLPPGAVCARGPGAGAP